MSDDKKDSEVKDAPKADAESKKQDGQKSIKASKDAQKAMKAAEEAQAAAEAAIAKAKEEQKKHIYLGSAQRPKDIYKLQFKGLEWFDEKKWDNDLETLKHTLQI